MPSTKATALTDAKGQFSISIPDLATPIEFSLIGYDTKKLIVRSGENGISVVMTTAVRAQR